MHVIRSSLLTLALSHSFLLFAAAFNGQLYIQNTHPSFQFECKYKIDNEERGPIIIYDDQPKLLGLVQYINDVQIKRYGKIAGIGADYHSFPDQLALCKQHPEQDCTLEIVQSYLASWTVNAKVGQAPERTPVAIQYPIEYFTKANAYGNKVEPRHVLDLGDQYTAKQVTERERTLREQITHANLGTMQRHVLQILNEAAVYANKLLHIADKASPEYTKNLLAFRGKLHPERTEQGRIIACNLYTGKPQYYKNRTLYLNAIIDLMWFYYDIAIQKNQAFSEGTFILQDTGNRIYDFLINYVTLVNPDALKATPSLAYPATIYFAYPRLSTHFVNEQNTYRQYGIDIRFEVPGQYNKPGSPQFLLPTQKSHLFFGKISEGLIFIKMEDYGVCGAQAGQHTIELGVAKLRKIAPRLSSSLQQYVPQYAQATKYAEEWAESYIGTDDDPNYRKEHMPQEVLNRSIEILQSAHLTTAQLKQLVVKFAEQGIHGIANEINDAASPIPPAQKNQLQSILNELQRRDGLDHPDIRRGREVIITNIELTQRCIKAMNF